jgi:hypothetical protein
MTKFYSLVLALALVTVLTIASANTASAKGKKGEPINFSTVLYMTEFPDVKTNPKSGLSTIDLETLAGTGLLSEATGHIPLNGLYLTARQSSHEQFTDTFCRMQTSKRANQRGRSASFRRSVRQSLALQLLLVTTS